MPKKDKIRRSKKKKHPVRVFFSIVALGVACFLSYFAFQDFMTTMKLKKEISNSEAQITNLENQSKELASEKTNLEDPEYVKRYARGRYMVSKPGEQVFKLPSKDSLSSSK